MEKIHKELKSTSQFLGALAVIQVANLLRDFSAVQNMDPSMLSNIDIASIGIQTSTLMSITKVVSVVPAALSILVLAFLCFKGWKEANDPSSAKSHIIISTIWMVVFGLVTVACLGDLISNPTDIVLQVLEVLVQGASTMLMFYYRKYAKQVRVVE